MQVLMSYSLTISILDSILLKIINKVIIKKTTKTLEMPAITPSAATVISLSLIKNKILTSNNNKIVIKS